jgi:hypothetical protein
MRFRRLEELANALATIQTREALEAKPAKKSDQAGKTAAALLAKL